MVIVGLITMNPDELIKWLYDHPEQVGIQVGFKDLTKIHGKWMREMIFGTGDYTLMAHRASYKSSCLSVAIALMMVLYPTENIIFLRKADKDVAEMLRMVAQALESQILKDIVSILYGRDLVIIERSQDHLSTNLWTSPMGAPQLLGLGLRSSITGKHSAKVITDDICNTEDRKSRAERENTKQVYYELHNICNRGGRIINLGTKWHKDDVFTIMPNQHIYTCYDTGLMTEAEIQQKRDEMSPSLFAANYELKYVADGNVLFPSALLDGKEANIYNGYGHIDAAYGGGDSVAFTIMKRNTDGSYTAYGKIWPEAHVENCLTEIYNLWEGYRCGTIFSERNADKGYLAKSLQGLEVPAQTYHEHQNKYVKISTHLKKAWKKIHWIPETDPEYLVQITDYTEQAAHDDAPDSAASLCRILDSKQPAANPDYLRGGL